MFLNLKNENLTVNSYRFVDTVATTQEDLLKSHREGSEECLTASIESILSVSKQPANDNYMASFTGLNQNDDFSNNEEALDIVAKDKKGAIETAAVIWGIDLDNVKIETN